MLEVSVSILWVESLSEMTLNGEAKRRIGGMIIAGGLMHGED